MSRSAGTLDPVWDDPTTYDALTHGPPYLPTVRTAMRSKRASVASMVQASAEVMPNALAFLASVVQSFEDCKMAELAAILSALRGLAVLHQTHHWKTLGSTFYGDHLLFERLYKAADDEIDGVAEKSVGTGGASLVCPCKQIKHMNEFIQRNKMGEECPEDPNGFAVHSLRAELFFMCLLQLGYKRLEANNLSLGVDNMLQGIADKHEESLYLLQQRMGQRRASALSWDAR